MSKYSIRGLYQTSAEDMSDERRQQLRDLIKNDGSRKSDIVKGLVFNHYSDGSGGAELNGKSILHYDGATNELHLTKSNHFVHYDNGAYSYTVSEFANYAERLAEKQAIEKYHADIIPYEKAIEDGYSVDHVRTHNISERNKIGGVSKVRRSVYCITTPYTYDDLPVEAIVSVDNQATPYFGPYGYTSTFYADGRPIEDIKDKAAVNKNGESVSFDKIKDEVCDLSDNAFYYPYVMDEYEFTDRYKENQKYDVVVDKDSDDVTVQYLTYLKRMELNKNYESRPLIGQYSRDEDLAALIKTKEDEVNRKHGGSDGNGDPAELVYLPEPEPKLESEPKPEFDADRLGEFKAVEISPDTPESDDLAL